MKRLITTAVLLSSTPFAFAQSSTYFGIEGGYAFVDISAEDTAQTIANATGSTTTVKYDLGALSGRVFAGSGINESLALELGAFASMSVDAKYSNATGTASEAYSVKGLDLSAKFMNSSNLFARGGVHYSQVAGDSQVTMAGVNYSGSGNNSGAGFLVGAGWNEKQADGSLLYFEYRYMNRLGGLSTANAHMLVLGWQK
jgi:hypothetical protein